MRNERLIELRDEADRAEKYSRGGVQDLYDLNLHLISELDRLTQAVRVFADDAEVIEFNDEAYVVNILKPKLDNLYKVARIEKESL